jgi:hypothetical protein
MRTHDFIVGGWIPDGARRCGALLLGELLNGELRYVGQVGSPADTRMMRAITRGLKPRTHSRFRDVISHPEAKFCEPAIRVGRIPGHERRRLFAARGVQTVRGRTDEPVIGTQARKKGAIGRPPQYKTARMRIRGAMDRAWLPHSRYRYRPLHRNQGRALNQRELCDRHADWLQGKSARTSTIRGIPDTPGCDNG